MRPSEDRLTAAQFARRAGMSDSRIRAMLAEPEKTPSDRRLPPADGTDASGRPWWWASTVDRWCRRTGRPVPADAEALYQWPTADAPAPVVHAGNVRVPARGLAPEVPVHVTVYDTAEGHIVWVQRYDEGGGVDREEAARAGALVLAPTWWTRARILVPGPLLLGGRLGGGPGSVPSVDAFRIEVPDRGLDRPAGPPRWLPTFIRSTGAAAELDPLDVEIVHAGLPPVDEVARVIGRPLPLWFADSCTTENMDRAELLGPGRQFTVPDTSTDWPAHRARVEAAYDWRLPRTFPRAWAALAADTLEALDVVLQTLQGTVTEGDGWYAPARPAEPDWPVAVETAARRAAVNAEATRPAPPTRTARAALGLDTPHELDPAEELDIAAEELDAAAAELVGVRNAEADLRWDDPAAVALWAAARSLEARLHRTHPDVVYDTVHQQVIEGDGRVAQAYRETLTPLEPAAQRQLREAPTRRLLRLLSLETDVETVRKYDTLQPTLAETTQLYHDRAGRLVAERAVGSRRRPDRVQLQIEWPTGHPPQDWTADTVIAGEDNVFALTPTPAGGLRVEPLPSSSGDTDYTWGYSGGGPTDLYRALVRGSLRMWEDPAPWIRRSLRDEDASPLWQEITTAGQTQPLRLPWPQVQAWAAADLDANPPDLELQITRTDGEIDSIQLVGRSPAELLYLERRLAGVGIVSDRLYVDRHGARKPDLLIGLGLRPADVKTVSDVLDADHLRFQRTDEDAEVA